jgi:hypothetical protein
VAAVTVAENVVAEVRPRVSDCPVVVVHRIVVPPIDVPRQRTTGPLFVVN